MNYRSITDKPHIQALKPGKTLWLCEACLIKKYTNSPYAMAKAHTACSCCGEVKSCQQVEKSRLHEKPPVPRKISVMTRFNIVKRKVA